MMQDEATRRNTSEYANHWAARWRRRYNYSSQSKIKHFRRVMRRNGLLKSVDWNVFDHGFGLGLMLFCFPRTCRLAGVELSQASVEAAMVEARSLGFAHADLRTVSAATPFPMEWRGAFDFVISSHVLEHLKDPADGLRQLRTLMKPDAMACFVVPINEKPGEDLNHFAWFDEASLLELLRTQGFVRIDSELCDRLWDLMAPLAYAMQRQMTPIRRLKSLLVNASTAFIPGPMLPGIDRILGWLGCRNRQLFVVCRRADDSALPEAVRGDS